MWPTPSSPPIPSATVQQFGSGLSYRVAVSSPTGDASHRDVDLVDLQLQNAATWSLLDNAVQTRELTVRLHGAALGITPFVVAVVDDSVALIIGALATVFLTAVSIVSFMNLDALRLLQFKLGVEEGRARVRLRRGQATYPTERSVRPPSLRRQHDPMGITTRSSLALVALDLVVAGVVGGLAATTGATNTTRALVCAGTGTLGAIAAALTIRWLVRRSAQAEQATADELDALGATVTSPVE